MPKYDLIFSPPLMNAAGSLGFAPDPHGPINLAHLGAFITNPVSLRSRSPCHGDRMVAYPGGFLLHTGHPNPGLRKVIQRYTRYWGRSPIPIILHLLVEGPSEVAAMVERLEGIEGVAGIELGLPLNCDAQMTLALVEAAAGELPLILRLPMERAAEYAQALVGSPLAAISLGAPRGTLPGSKGEIVQGRLFGPAVFPLALGALHSIVRSGLPVIGAGGIYHPQDVEAMLAAGAMAVQLDAVLWHGGIDF